LKSRRRRIRQPHRVLSSGAVAAFLGLALSAPNAYAAGTFAVTAQGSAHGLAAMMPMGKPPAVTLLEASVRLDWAPSTLASGREVGGYLLNRQVLGSTTVVQICSVAAPFRTCQDSPPAGQQVVYTVVPTQGLWRGPASAPSAPVTMPAPALAAPAAVPSPSPTLTPTPTPTPAPTPTPMPSPSATTTPSPAASPSPTPGPTPTPTTTPSPA
jgi:hypothetical protein